MPPPWPVPQRKPCDLWDLLSSLDRQEYTRVTTVHSRLEESGTPHGIPTAQGSYKPRPGLLQMVSQALFLCKIF